MLIFDDCVFISLVFFFKGRKTIPRAPLHPNPELPNGPETEGGNPCSEFPVQPSTDSALVFTVNKLYCPLEANGAVDWCLLITAGSGV